MLYAGEDIKFIARRIMICASEDVGNADPQALVVAVAAAQAVERLGMPEAQITLSQAVTYVASAPKSNAACMAVFSCIRIVKSVRTTVPPHLQDSHYKGAAKLDMVWDINMPTIIRIIMWSSSICLQRYWGVIFMSLRRMGMKRISEIIWNDSQRIEVSMPGGIVELMAQLICHKPHNAHRSISSRLSYTCLLLFFHAAHSASAASFVGTVNVISMRGISLSFA